MDIKTKSSQVVVESTSVAPQQMVLEYGLMRESFSSPYVPIDRHGWSVQDTLPSDIRSYALNDLAYHRFLRKGAIGSFYYHESKITHFIVVKDCDSEKEPIEFAVLDNYVSANEPKHSEKWHLSPSQISTQKGSTQMPSDKKSISCSKCRLYIGIWLESPP